MLRRQTTTRTAWLRRCSVVGVALLALTTTGCAPNALNFQRDDTIRQGLPLAKAHTAWAAIDLENVSDSAITLRALKPLSVKNAKISHIGVIKVTAGNAIGFYYPPVTAGMRTELANEMPLPGFRLPPHTSSAAYQAVFQLAATDRAQDASTADVDITYAAGSSTWTETRHSGFCLYVEADHGCDHTQPSPSPTR